MSRNVSQSFSGITGVTLFLFYFLFLIPSIQLYRSFYDLYHKNVFWAMPVRSGPPIEYSATSIWDFVWFIFFFCIMTYVIMLITEFEKKIKFDKKILITVVKASIATLLLLPIAYLLSSLTNPW